MFWLVIDSTESQPPRHPIYLGLLYDMSAFPYTVKITMERRTAVLATLLRWQTTTSASVREVQALLGLLVWIADAIPELVVFLFGLRAVTWHKGERRQGRVTLGKGFQRAKVQVHILLLIYAYIYSYTHTYTHIFIHIHILIYTYIYSYTHKNIHIYTYTYT
jgi:hypothetical protein